MTHPNRISFEADGLTERDALQTARWVQAYPNAANLHHARLLAEALALPPGWEWAEAMAVEMEGDRVLTNVVEGTPKKAAEAAWEEHNEDLLFPVVTK